MNTQNSNTKTRKYLVIGGGGREHALAWKIAQSPMVEKVYVAPGNGGTANEPKLQNVDISVDELTKMIEFCQANNIYATVVGPEAPLVNGIKDEFDKAGLLCFAPSKKAAQLEGSKAFTKDFLARHKIPSAQYQTFSTLSPALDYLKSHKYPLVIKADGLAAGKGVVICEGYQQAESTCKEMLNDLRFGKAGQRIVIEDFLVGEEASFICMIDGDNILPLASSQDHKALLDGDQGPNTGGMGAYSPAPRLQGDMFDRCIDEVIKPTLAGLKSDGINYFGFLYAGLMIGEDGTPMVLEFNCRLGDPETQPIMMRLESDLVDVLDSAFKHKLNEVTLKWNPKPALGVVIAQEGYPGDYAKGAKLNIDKNTANDTKIFQAGTVEQDGNTITSGGRVLCITALGENVADAQKRAYELVKTTAWPGSYYRTDIGYRAIEKT